MRNQELIDYFQKVVKAENLKYFIQQAIDKANDSAESLEKTFVVENTFTDSGLLERAPIEYRHLEIPEHYNKPFKSIGVESKPIPHGFDTGEPIVGGLIMGCIGFVVLTAIILIENDFQSLQEFVKKALLVLVFCSVAFGFLTCWCGGLLFGLLTKPKNKKEDQVRLAKWERDRLRVYQQADLSNKNRDILYNEIRHEIGELNMQLSQVEAMTTELYDQRDIPKQARGIIAAHSILDYLEMGICTELEGRDGAFAQFLEDVRVNKICSKLDDVVDAVNNLSRSVQGMTNAILSAQASLCEEIRQTRNRLDSFASDVHADMERIANQNDLRQSSLDKLNSTQTAIVWNQYIAAQKMGISAGMRRS